MLRKTSSTYKFSDEDIESLKKYSKMSLEDPAVSHCIDMPDEQADNKVDSDYGFYCILDINDQYNKPGSIISYKRQKMGYYDYLCSPYIDGPETHIWTPNTKDLDASDLQYRLSNYILTITNSIIAMATLFALWKSK